jgi:hypothetical protein
MIDILSIMFILSINQCGVTSDSPQVNSSGIKIIALPLAGEIAERYAEISGLTWYKDQLILLPQYPGRFSSNNFSSIFRIPKEEIIKYLDQSSTSSQLSPIKIEFNAKEIPDRLPGFQGYESIVFVENKVYLTIEINLEGSMQALLVEGSISDNMERIELDESSLYLLPMPLQIKNYAYESMIHVEGKLLIFYEANGSNLTDAPQMIEVNLKNGESSVVPFLNLEYRITDVTASDKDGFFLVLNYYWPGDFKILKPALDQLAGRSDPGLRFSKDKPVERLVEMQYLNDKIKLGDSVPIQLQPAVNGDSRNWEGIVRLDNRGFILATDKHPQTILAFLPYE